MSSGFRVFFHSIILFVCLFVSFSAPGIECVKAFIKGSRLDYELRQAERRADSEKFQPTSTDPKIDRSREKYWNEEPETPQLLKAFLPDGVHFLKYQQYEPSSPVVIKFDEPGASLIARAHYTHEGASFATNVVFSRRAILDNMKGEKNWLVGSKARAAILFLHGGGTRTTGAHVARTMINHFSDLQVDVVAIDLPWHNQGHRKLVNFETEIKILGNFAKKFIPPNVPLFVWGHSYGSVFADQLRMMTDRPNNEFSFHNNLKGALIMSTAVDPAPGKSPHEKLQALHKIREEVYQNRFHESAEVEQQVHRNIIGEGKISPLGGFVAMLNLMQLDQTLPSHRGRQWIPGQMIVGISDLLVYIGYESQYGVYRRQENMQTHYLEKAPHLKDKNGPAKEVGHLLGDYLDPHSKKPINFIKASDFIAEQLRIGDIKDFIIQELTQSAINSASKETILKELNWMRLVETIELSLTNNPAFKRLEPEIISNIQTFINTQKNTPVLSKNKDLIPNYIHIVQEFANNMAFRDFLKDAKVFKESKTVNVKNFLNENKEIQNKVRDIIQPYNTAQIRVFYFLEGIKTENLLMENNREYLSALKSEMKHIIEVSILKINSITLKNDLLNLQSLLLQASSTKDFEAITNKAREIKEKYRKVWPDQIIRSNNSENQKISPLRRAIFSATNLNAALNIISHRENLPKKITDKLTPLLERYFEIQDIINGQYVPNLARLRQKNLIPEGKKEKRVENIHRSLTDNVQLIKKLTRELSKLQAEEKQLRAEHKTLLNKVRSYIKTIKEALAIVASSDTPLLSLRNEYQESRLKLEELSKVQWEMEQLFDKIAVEILKDASSEKASETVKSDANNDSSSPANRNVSAQKETADHLLQEHQEVINRFSDLFSRYVQDRRILRRKTITAIENGELGERNIRDFKEAVIALYGPHSQGRRPALGVNALYLDLEKVIIKLAELEAKKLQTRELLILAKMEYKNEMASLTQLLENKTEESEAIIAKLRQSANIVNILSSTISNVLNKSVIKDSNMANYIDQEALIFKNIFTQWSDLQSSLPPMLPTE